MVQNSIDERQMIRDLMRNAFNPGFLNSRDQFAEIKSYRCKLSFAHGIFG